VEKGGRRTEKHSRKGPPTDGKEKMKPAERLPKEARGIVLKRSHAKDRRRGNSIKGIEDTRYTRRSNWGKMGGEPKETRSEKKSVRGKMRSSAAWQTRRGKITVKTKPEKRTKVQLRKGMGRDLGYEKRAKMKGQWNLKPKCAYPGSKEGRNRGVNRKRKQRARKRINHPNVRTIDYFGKQ